MAGSSESPEERRAGVVERMTGRSVGMLLWTLGVLLAVMLGGCPHSGVPQDQNPAGSPRIVKSTDPEGDAQRMLEDGYLRLGFSYFPSLSADAGEAREKAREVHADVVMIYPARAGEGNGGLVSYWAKSPPPVFGVHMQDLLPESRTKSGTGTLVTAVVKDSPAGRAGIVRGDVIRKIDGKEVNSSAALYDVVTKLAGRKVTVELLRDGRRMEKEVQLGREQ